MRYVRIAALVLLLAGIGVGSFLLLRYLGAFGDAAGPQVSEVPEGDQEVAWIYPATSGVNWQRFIDGIAEVAKRRSELQVDTSDAWPLSSTAVPEVVLGWSGVPNRLRIRWYKLTGELGVAQWIQALAERDPPPLAIIGGDNSNRAKELAEELNRIQETLGARTPLLLITTATADQVGHIGGAQQELMRIYRGRSFRFSFTNKQMAEAVTDFVLERPDLWTANETPHPPLSPAGGEGRVRGDDHGVFVFRWSDDSYSMDLANQFIRQFQGRGVAVLGASQMPYSVGRFDVPNPDEQEAVELLLGRMQMDAGRRRILVLPAGQRPARRVLHALASAWPEQSRNLVAVTGDSIAFDTIYRDRSFAWDIRDIPIPLVIFRHEQPLPPHPPLSPAGAERAARDDEKVDYGAATAMDDLLLNARIVETLIEAAYPAAGRRQLLAQADQLAANLRSAKFSDPGNAHSADLFDSAGNRRSGSGEHVVCLRPHIDAATGRVARIATLEIWAWQGKDQGPACLPVRSLKLGYGTEGTRYGQ